MEYLSPPNNATAATEATTAALATQLTEQPTPSGFDIRALLFRLLRNWWMLLIGLMLGYMAARLVLRYREVTQEVSAIIQIEEDKSTGVSEQIIVQEFGYENEQNLETEIQMMKSRSLLLRVVDKLGLDINFFTDGRVRNFDLYRSTSQPVKVVRAKVNATAYGKLLSLHLLENERFAFGYESKVDTFRFNLPFTNRFGSFLFERDSLVIGGPQDLLLKFSDPKQIAQTFAQRLQITPVRSSNLLEMSLVDRVPQRGIDVIEAVIATYDSLTINIRNQSTNKTIDFIDERIDEFSQDLTAVERRAEDFIRDNDLLVDIPTNLQLQLEEFRELETQLAQLRLQLSAVDNLAQYIQNETNELQLIPFTAEIANLDLSTLIQQYNTLLIERKTLLSSAGPGNPALTATNAPLQDLEYNILEAVVRAREELTTQIEATNRQGDIILEAVRGVPGQRRQLLGIEREQKIKEELYLFLLQKREETGLTQAVTASGLRIVEAPIVEGPTGPPAFQIYLFGLLFGLLLPVGGLTVAELLDNTIKTTEQVKSFSQVPVIGSVGVAKGKSNIVITPSSRTAIAEMFRSVRTNLAFIAAGKQQQVIMITSSMSGEGKSFVSINLGMSLAISDKRVCLVGMDLRKPKLELYLSDQQATLGISSYLVNPELAIDDIVKSSETHPNLHYIGSGPVPPNPAELLLTDRMTLLIANLRERYDYVIIDTPPVGVVVDGFLISPYTDSTIYITRFGKTKLSQLRILNDAVRKQQVKNPAILLNGVKAGIGYYSYGYYGYGYGYGYGDYYTSAD